ncbi:MAG TPA: hypothetical protein VM012_04885 [Flavitalea sp.]|nr:hypothetical protein [Flavitalea sp.]
MSFYYLSRPAIYSLMATDFEQKKKSAYTTRRSIMDIGMGCIYTVLGGFFVFKEFFHVTLDFPPIPFNYIFGALCMLYGGFRIYRGLKKNYFQ